MRPPREEMLKQFDKDGDGQISETEREAMREARKAAAEARREGEEPGGDGEGLLIKHGEIIKKVPEQELLNVLREELLNWK